MTKQRKAIGLCRVSTQEQGTSRLSLEWQTAEIERYCEQHNIALVDVFEEIGPGGKRLDQREVLQEVLTKARKRKCLVIVAKLDRLARSVHLISSLMAEGIPFITVEFGADVDPMSLHLMAAFAEAERQKISARVKASYEARRARGVTDFGHSDTLSQEVNRRRKQLAKQDAEAYRKVLSGMVSLSWREAARRLNDMRVRAPSGGDWNHRAVGRCLKRLALA